MGDGKSMDFLGFSHSIILKMLSLKVAKNLRIPAGDNMNRLVGKHFPSQRKVEGVEKRSNKIKQCRVCYARGLRTLNGKPIVTVWICKDCDGELGLHVEEAYHTKADYSVVKEEEQQRR